MNMRKAALAFAGAAAIGVGMMMATGVAQAAPAGLSIRLSDGIIASGLVEKVQYRYRGRQYCFYFDAWRGPGWYRCGYSSRRGYGWGGPIGWRGWNHGQVYRAPAHRAPAYRHSGPRSSAPKYTRNPPNFREQYPPRRQPRRED
jgi:hypothetical protein